MSLPTSDFQLHLKAHGSDLWTEEADAILTILGWIGFEMGWEPDTVKNFPELLTWDFWHHQLKWFDSFVELLSDFRPHERLLVPIVYPPVSSEMMVNHLNTYRKIKDSRRFWNAFDVPVPLSPALSSKWRRTSAVLKAANWRDYARLLVGMKWKTLSPCTFEYPFHLSRRQSSSCTITLDQSVQMLSTPITDWIWDLIMNGSTHSISDELPKVNVDWWSACEFCNRLSEFLGLEPVYEYRHYNWLDVLSKELPSIPHFAWKKTNGIRLPTQAEWFYLCGRGKHHQKGAPQRESNATLTHIKSEPTIRNSSIQEWCWDTYSPHYWSSKNVHLNPSGPIYFQVRKVLVGPSSGKQSSVQPIPFEDMTTSSKNIGFRVVRSGD
ncbi:MAG: SUMF1/EgtB/PvdO family nonheme iron enzyme [Myxococcota bacterium]